MKFLFVIFLLPLQLFAQDITGVWTGTLYNDTTKQFIKYELAISEENGKLSGYSRTIFVINSFENIGLKSIKVKKAGNEFLVEDDKLIYNNYTEPPARGVKTYSELVLSQNDTAVILSGPWNTNRTKVYSRLTGNIFLQKKKKIRETLIIAELQNFGLASSLSFMTPPLQQKNLAVADNNPQINPGMPGKQVVESEGSTLNAGIPANNTIEQNGKQGETGEQIPENNFNKEDTPKEKAQVRGTRPGVENMTLQKRGDTETILPASILLPLTITWQPGKKISGELLNKDAIAVNEIVKKAPSAVTEVTIPGNETANRVLIKSTTQKTGAQNKTRKENSSVIPHRNTAENTIIKEAPSPVTEMTMQENETAHGVSINSTAQQTATQNKTKKEKSGAISGKDTAVNNHIIKASLSPIAEISRPKKEPGNIASSKSTRPEVSRQSKTGKENPYTGLKDIDSNVNKLIIKKVPSPVAEITAPKYDAQGSMLKSVTQQFDDRQQPGEEIPGIILPKSNKEGITLQPATTQPAAAIATRKIETIRSVDIKSDSLLLTLYDNGEIDGDTVSVLLNGKVIMPMQGLMSKAINKTIYLTPEMGDSIVLIMYAENLGSIPPNTGLLVIHDGDDIYEIRFTGDLEKNSSIILKRKRRK